MGSRYWPNKAAIMLPSKWQRNKIFSIKIRQCVLKMSEPLKSI